MNGHETAQVSALCQALYGLVLALALGPWLTIAGLRVISKPSRVEERSLINWVIRRASTHSGRGNTRFWAWMVLVTGLGMDLIGVFMLVVAIIALFR